MTQYYNRFNALACRLTMGAVTAAAMDRQTMPAHSER